ncbi:MAG: hypothetical protein J7604_20295 [Sporocytophaga sp.]|uniref:hypothetical protein n=1 Tax=Sporocytophaga sp. TaxID=2231183 RepID=UPI001B1B4A11|nr:hypothetical protein [Sporocytophaga sp.]MBO9702563.1 hypothetical protein [Sporocytophaga sp.]
MTIFNMKIGFEFVIRHFVIDVYSGIGGKFKSINYIGPAAKPGCITWSYNSTPIEGNHLTFTVPMNVKLGYPF